MVELPGFWTASKASVFTWIGDDPPPDKAEQSLDEEQLEIYPSAHVEVNIDKKTLRIWEEGREGRGYTGDVIPGQNTRVYGNKRPSLHIRCRNRTGVHISVFVRPSDENDEHRAGQMVDQLLQLFAEVGGHTY
jgi:hypothetical protein